MTNREWALVTAVVGLGILAQIPGHMASDGENDHGAMDHSTPAALETAPLGAARVSLHVVGMT